MKHEKRTNQSRISSPRYQYYGLILYLVHSACPTALLLLKQMALTKASVLVFAQNKEIKEKRGLAKFMVEMDS